jgi:purine-binding chemotaxis protein CheW
MLVMMGGRILKIVTFRINNELYALPVDTVKSIERMQPIRPVPMAPENIIGIMNLRGIVMTVIDLRAMLKMHQSEYTPDTRLLVIKEFAYIVDEAMDVLEIEYIQVEMQDDEHPLVEGIIQQGEKLIVMIKSSNL